MNKRYDLIVVGGGHAGVEAASGAMAAHHRMLRTGEAQYVDLSAQSVMTWTMLNAMDAHAIQGAEFQRGGGLVDPGLDANDVTIDGSVDRPLDGGILRGDLDRAAFGLAREGE